MKKDVLVEKIISLNKNTMKLFNNSMDEVAKKYNISKADVFILSVIHTNPKLEKSCNIVKEHNFSKAYVSGAINSLKNSGYIKVTIDESDKRYQKIEILEKATPIIQSLNEKLASDVKTIKKDISEEEINIMLSIIDKIIDNVNNKKEDKNV